MSDVDTGVLLPEDDAGRRSSSAFGRAVVADGLRAVDAAGALGAEREGNWRTGYPVHFRRLLEAGLVSRTAAVQIATDGLAAVRDRMRFGAEDGEEIPLDSVAFDAARDPLATATIPGGGEAEREFSLPLGGERLSGDALGRRLDEWVTAGVVEPSTADTVRTVMAHPEWLRLDGHTVVVLGAGAEMGPLPALLRWGARVAAIDLPGPALWRRVVTAGRDRAGTLLLPVPPDHDGDPADAAGLDLLSDLATAAEWIRGLDGRVVLGNYVYADGVTNLRLAAAVDALADHLGGVIDDLALAFLATPTDVFAVPGEAVEQSHAAYEHRSRLGKVVGRPLRAVSGGRLLRRQYVTGAYPGVHDALVAQQGPNYALAKRLHRWRATVARDAGATVSMNVAPPTRTRSVVKNRALAAAYAQAHRFSIEVFEPATANTLMAALLVADLHTGGGPAHEHPWQDEAHDAVHGGLWRGPYQPRSALGIAAVLGYGAART
ncbi:MAG TPA: hypothetical protein VGN18_02615 [Jatrophihabitans sp.]|jgi:hypothetical protein|uniref:hypothetical protein n=1 Tax=Jatrophihabitans sp. TaxID=1932789 RepID=UPI002E025026|nr:hypothetical protein [Jatrophihabitans sp.]